MKTQSEIIQSIARINKRVAILETAIIVIAVVAILAVVAVLAGR